MRLVKMRIGALRVVAILCILSTPSTSARSDSITLSYPLKKSENAYTADITAVLDHSLKTSGSFRCDGLDQKVTAYTGEDGGAGLGQRGKEIGTTCSPSRYAYGQDGKKPFDDEYPPRDFLVTGKYVSEPLFLSYDGHAGYDFDCGNFKDPINAEPIFAAADGILIIPDEDPINGNHENFKTFAIGHGGGWETWYLHAANRPDPKNFPGIIKAGQEVAKCYNSGLKLEPGEPPGSRSHLHFEVRRQGKIVDPFGWEWFESDPFAERDDVLVQTEPLWGIPRPFVSDVQLTKQSETSYSAVINGVNFADDARVTLWDKAGKFALCFENSPNVCPLTCYCLVPNSRNNEGTRLEATIPVSRPEGYVLKVKNLQQGTRSGPWDLGWDLDRGPQSLEFVRIGEQAPGGGMFVGFGGFYDANRSGRVVFEASIDIDGDNIGDETGTYENRAGAIQKVELLGIAKVGGVRFNDIGDMALADASVAGRTQAIYFLAADSSVPTRVVQWDDRSTVNDWTYYDPRGPLAMNQDGEFTFQSSLYDVVTNTVYCCYLFLYSPDTDNILLIVGDPVVGDNVTTPIGGTFNLGAVNHNGFASNGDVVFWSKVDGGNANAGIFLFTRLTLQYSKVVADGDLAPGDIGGSYIGVGIGPAAVAGRRLVFTSSLIDGGAENGIFVKGDVELESTADISLIAQPGQSTGTSVGGSFSGFGGRPFDLGWPQIREDGGVVFISILEGAITTRDGLPTDRGVFLWTGREFIKVVVENDRLANGQLLAGVSSYVSNDAGWVYYYVARAE